MLQLTSDLQNKEREKSNPSEIQSVLKSHKNLIKIYCVALVSPFFFLLNSMIKCLQHNLTATYIRQYNFHTSRTSKSIL